MSRKAHLICAKCGDAEETFFKIGEPVLVELDGEPPHLSVYISCGNCGELTGLTEWNEHNGHSDKTPEFLKV